MLRWAPNVARRPRHGTEQGSSGRFERRSLRALMHQPGAGCVFVEVRSSFSQGQCSSPTLSSGPLKKKAAPQPTPTPGGPPHTSSSSCYIRSPFRSIGPAPAEGEGKTVAGLSSPTQSPCHHGASETVPGCAVPSSGIEAQMPVHGPATSLHTFRAE
ncbi:hypothetical protein NDU88_001099 [Pleurodeles waltl]|uniref:Uncharacterized protein n=1 Tax=Pleurodeles waltl TaxID=8319 RepID=A0AAV7R990_PLEWA|nr:hypothetical protein NDU88_001099 [Pleurodeles waltl]